MTTPDWKALGVRPPNGWIPNATGKRLRPWWRTGIWTGACWVHGSILYRRPWIVFWLFGKGWKRLGWLACVLLEWRWLRTATTVSTDEAAAAHLKRLGCGLEAKDE